VFLYSSKESLVIVKIFDFEILGVSRDPGNSLIKNMSLRKNVCPSIHPSVRTSVRPSVTLSGAKTTGPILILKSGNVGEKSGDGAESILAPLTLTTRRLEPENLEKKIEKNSCSKTCL
jgi:hypothetical protein